MSGRDITAVIGQNTYYEAVGTKRSFNDGNNDVDTYLVKITKADDKSREGKFALIRSTKHAGDQPSGDKYVTDITYGEQCDLLNQLNTPKKVTLSTRTFDGTAPVDDPNKAGTKQPTETTADKEWDLKANETEWKGLGASMPSTVTKACSAKPPGAAGSAPAVSKTDNKTGIDALSITNTTAANKLIVNADQIADAADATKKNVATGELALQAKAPAAAPDANSTANIKTPPGSKFSKTGPIELTFENPIQLATGKALDDSTIGIYEVDAAGTVKRDTKQTGLQYKFKGNKLTITRPPNSEFTPETKYRIVIASDILLNDDRKAANSASITYDFEAITPTK